MKSMFYPKFALSSIRKNKKLYLPYLLTNILWISMFYIVSALSNSSILIHVKGGKTLAELLKFSWVIILFFSFLFIFYTSSFLSKQRNKEYALYNILGMNNKNLSLILFFETAFVTTISIGIGLITGISFYTLFEKILLNIINAKTQAINFIDINTFIKTLTGYSFIFTIILILSVVKINIIKPIELLKSRSLGEKPPKANYILGILGVIILSIAYYIALTTNDPVEALKTFFIAVALVIIGTFLIFISGSILFLNILKKNKAYYYKANHFISLSQMIFRLRRNALSLASITILLTMILVTVSSTFSVFMGANKSLNIKFPKDYVIEIIKKTHKPNNNYKKVLSEYTEDIAKSSHTKVSSSYYYSYLQSYNKVKVNGKKTTLFVLDLKEYNRLHNKNIKLKDNEILYYSKDIKVKDKNLKVLNTKLKIKNILKDFISIDRDIIEPFVALVVNDSTTIWNIEPDTFRSKFLYSFSTLKNDINITENLKDNLKKIFKENPNISLIGITSKQNEEINFFAIYKGLFFIAIVLSILFSSATVLIIYYKQIVEGYEDKKRYEIIRKIGLTKKEMKKSINSQLLTIFFLPIIVSGMHLAFSFPVIDNLLALFKLKGSYAFIYSTIGSFIIFSILYSLVYFLTSKVYYNIVKK